MRTHQLLPLVLAAGLAAQTTYTFPSDHAAIANGTFSTSFFPYSYGVSRMQAAYEAWDMTVPTGSPIARIGFRQEGTNASTGHALQLEVLMGYTNLTAATLTNNYASNYAGAMTSVFGPALYTLPNLTSSGGQTVWLNLTTPFNYNPAPGQNLLVEWRITANNNGNAAWSYYLDRANFNSPVVTGPTGCMHSGNNTAQLTSQPATVGGNWSLGLTRAPASSFVLLLQGLGTLTPPYPLAAAIPGISPTCTGQLLPNGLHLSTALTNSGGGFTWTVRLPNSSWLNDVQISSQCAILDFFAPGGMVVSNGDQMQIGIDPAQTILYSQGSTTAATGSVQRNYGVVTLFQ